MTASPQSDGGWRDAILSQFTQTIAPFSPITVVADPDRLLSEQKLLSSMNERGFEVASFDDPIELRYLYESRFRGRKSAAQSSRLVIATADENAAIPFDIRSLALEVSRVLSFGLSALFPYLTPSVVAELDRDDLDPLFRAQQLHQPGQLGENATRDFILRHVCEIAPELIRTPAELLRVLLRRHYQQRQYPLSVDYRFISHVRGNGRFSDWPLETIVPDRGMFISFLQERWDCLIRARAGQAPSEQRMKVDGPAELPFEHPDIKVYIENLCLEGVLKPVPGVSKDSIGDSWLAIGAVIASRDAARERFEKLTAHLMSQIPGQDSVNAEWTTFAYRWAEWNVMRQHLVSDERAFFSASVVDIQAAVDAAFERWLSTNYGALGSLSYLPRPIMVHQIVWSMAYGWSPSLTSKKRALIVIDGLALDQWLIVREALGVTLQFAEGASFAWIPTLTAISRQSIFAGESPLFFPQSLGTTSKEEQHWRRFWENRGVHRDRVVYLKQKEREDTHAFIARVTERRRETKCSVLGVVIGVIDDMIHGSAMGSGGLHVQVRYWSQAGYLRSLVETLIDDNFDVHITSDHGNVEARGMGKPNLGVVAEQRGERVHVVTDESVAIAVHKAFPRSICWPSIGLPGTFLPLIAKGRDAFVAETETIVCHGGIALEEVVVPCVRVTGRRT